MPPPHPCLTTRRSPQAEAEVGIIAEDLIADINELTRGRRSAVGLDADVADLCQMLDEFL